MIPVIAFSMRLPGDDVAWPEILAEEFHNELPRLYARREVSICSPDYSPFPRHAIPDALGRFTENLRFSDPYGLARYPVNGPLRRNEGRATGPRALEIEAQLGFELATPTVRRIKPLGR